MRLQRVAADEIDEAEAARIVVGNGLAVIEMQRRRGRVSGLSKRSRWKAPGIVVSAASTRNDPDMPRWAISVSPPSSWKSRYFARRASPAIRRPGQALAEAGREGKADVFLAAVRPLRCALRPWPARGRAGRSRPRAVQAFAWSRITARNAGPYFCSLTAPTPCSPARPFERARPRPWPSRSECDRGR